MNANEQKKPGSGATPDKSSAGTTPNWFGLSRLNPAQKKALVRDIAPLIKNEFSEFFRRTQSYWLMGRGPGLKDPVRFANELAGHKFDLVEQFNHLIEKDLATDRYPPSYKFSGISFARGGSDLAILDDYQSTRRSLRHELEGILRSQRDLHFIMAHAATSEQRFQYPNWAPWMPLHWFERLFEVAEEHFGASDLTLALLDSYSRYLSGKASEILTPITEILTRTGLFEMPQTLHQEASSPHASPHASPPASPPVATDTASPARAQATSTSADPWANRLLDRMDTERAAAPAAGVGFGFGFGSLAAAAATPMTSPQAMAPTPSTQIKVQDLLKQIPEDLPEEYLTPFMQDVLETLLQEILRGWSLNPDISPLFGGLNAAVAEILTRDRDFFSSPGHPLRVWLSALFGLSCRFDPQQPLDTDASVNRFLLFLKGSIEQLNQQAGTLNRALAQQLVDQWRGRLAQEDRFWLENNQGHQHTLRMDENAARAQRNLASCALESTNPPPMAAAQEIVTAWRELLDFTPNTDSDLHTPMRNIVSAICLRRSPMETAADISQLKAQAHREGVPDARIRSLLGRLAKSHILSLRAEPGAKLFNPQQQLRVPLALTLADDDPNMDTELEDAARAEVDQSKVGDWFEFTSANGHRVQRMGLIWHGETTRAFLFLSLDGLICRHHSLPGFAHELRTGRLRPLPDETLLDRILTS